METTVIINGLSIQVSKLSIDQVEKDGKTRKLIDMEFQVTSEDYHDVTSTLYKKDLTIQVPAENFEMKATIYNYSTSITDLYKEGNVGDFKLSLLEKE